MLLVLRRLLRWLRAVTLLELILLLLLLMVVRRRRTRLLRLLIVLLLLLMLVLLILLTRPRVVFTSADLGIMYRVSWLSRAVFAVGVLLVRGIDAAVRLFLPTFSICRLVSRVLGYQFTVKLLMDQTRPLALPDALLNQPRQDSSLCLQQAR